MSNSQRPASFGIWLKQARAFHNITLDELSEKSGVSRGHIWHIEKHAKNPTLETAGKLTAAFNLKLWKIIKLIDP
jgi:transcriptional regulator with XRE-family HTH domain